MHATTSRIRPRIAITLLTGLGLLASGCTTPVTWETVEVIPQRLSVEFPGPDEGEELSEPVPGTDLVVRGLGREIGDDYFASTTVSLPPGTPFDLDASVDGAVENALADMEGQAGEEGVSEIVELDSVQVAGVDSRRVTASLRAGDIETSYHSRILVLDDELVQITVVDGGSDNAEDADRFLDSLAEV